MLADEGEDKEGAHCLATERHQNATVAPAGESWGPSATGEGWRSVLLPPQSVRAGAMMLR
jgi:hypothetical protein